MNEQSGQIGPGYTFLLEHLWVIISQPDSNGCVLIVNFTSMKAHADGSCIVKRGEHPFIKWDSFIFYKKASLVDIEKIQEGIENGDIIPKEWCSSQLLQKIKEGALKSDFLTAKYRTYIK